MIYVITLFYMQIRLMNNIETDAHRLQSLADTYSINMHQWKFCLGISPKLECNLRALNHV